MLLLACSVLSTYLYITTSQPTTCTDPSGCNWDCPNACTDITYNCTSIASSCTLTCVSCNGTSIFSSADNFNLICVGSTGCTNMDITAENPHNHIHIITAATPTTPPTKNRTTFHYQSTLTPTKSPIATTITDLNTNTIMNHNNIAAVDEVDTNTIGGLIIFAGVLSGMFCLCVCVGVIFVCHTKRKSKLRKNTGNEYDRVNYEVPTAMEVQCDVVMDETHTKQSQTKQSQMIQELQIKIKEREIANNQMMITHTITPLSNYGDEFKKNPCDANTQNNDVCGEEMEDEDEEDTFNPVGNDNNYKDRYLTLDTVTHGHGCMDDDDSVDDDIRTPSKSRSVKKLIKLYNHL